MRKLELSMCATVVASLLCLPALAQETPGTVARIGVFEPKPGAAAQFEQGRKKHFEFHRKENDTWSWFTWEVISGEHEGTYITGTFGHQWKDFDAWEKLDRADTADDADVATLQLAVIARSPANGGTTWRSRPQPCHRSSSPRPRDCVAPPAAGLAMTPSVKAHPYTTRPTRGEDA